MKCACEHCGETFDAEPTGGHRLMCGDATKAEDVARALNGVEPLLMVADPPYGVSYDANWRNNAPINRARSGGKREMIGGRAVGEVLNDDRCDWRDAWALFPGDVAYIWHGALHGAEVQEKSCGCRPVRQITDHLGQESIRYQPGRLSFSARAVLVRRP